MKVCFIGVGSIAKRHIRNLKELYGDEMEIDVLRSGKGGSMGSELEKIIQNTYHDFESLPEDYDIIFITNPTRLHYQTLQRVHGNGRHFFIEKPVFETGQEDWKELHLRADSVYYVACPLRYSNVIQYLKRTLDFSQIYSIRCISSSYLPEWRPGTDYRETYSAKKEMGGGVSIDLIHEWDYICELVGVPEQVKCFITKKSDLEIDSDDLAVYIAEYKDKVAELHLDYFGRYAERRIELFGKEDTIEADLIGQTITYRKSGNIVVLHEERDSMQKKELQNFFRIIEGKEKNNNPIPRACQTLKITRGYLE